MAEIKAMSDEMNPSRERRPRVALPYAHERHEVAYFMRRLYKQKLTTTSGGNISLRLTAGPLAGAVALTPAALDKGRTRAAQVGLIALDGTNLTPELRATSEFKMHLEIYRACPHVGAVVHAHPLTASTFTATGDSINTELLAESYYQLQQPVFARYALTATDELAEIVAECATRANVILMENHGVTAVGRTLLEAFDRLELIETAAQMTLMARQLGKLSTLTAERKTELDALRERSNA